MKSLLIITALAILSSLPVFPCDARSVLGSNCSQSEAACPEGSHADCRGGLFRARCGCTETEPDTRRDSPEDSGDQEAPSKKAPSVIDPQQDTAFVDFIMFTASLGSEAGQQVATVLEEAYLAGKSGDLESYNFSIAHYHHLLKTMPEDDKAAIGSFLKKANQEFHKSTI